MVWRMLKGSLEGKFGVRMYYEIHEVFPSRDRIMIQVSESG